MELKIEPEAINKYVADKIIESALGETIKKAIDKQVANINLADYYNNPLKNTVEQFANDCIRKYLEEHYTAHFQEAVKNFLTPEKIAEFAKASVEGLKFKNERY